MTSAERRRAPRYAADWAARYRLANQDEWRPCRVVDVSFDGAALELTSITIVDGLAGPIELTIASVADGEIGVALRGVIRRHIEVNDGRVMVGIEFSALRAEERNLLHLLVGLRAQP